jgi:hypothetical protein
VIDSLGCLLVRQSSFEVLSFFTAQAFVKKVTPQLIVFKAYLFLARILHIVYAVPKSQ